MPKMDIMSLNFNELRDEILKINMPSFRAKQIYSWLHQKLVSSFDEMSNLSKADRERLNEYYYITTPKIKRKLVSKIDGTVKYLFELADGECIETVLMKYKHGNTVCVSTQVGCRMGCDFCASTIAGFRRNLTSAEILSEIYMAQKDSGERVSNIVLMGIGEPLDNYDNVIRFLSQISDENGLNISLRHISLSTCGVVDKIYELAKLKLGLTLSISLHAVTDEKRDKIMKINHRWNIEKLLEACKHYAKVTGRRISFEYALIKGQSDTPEDAVKLASLLKGMLCHVNLIPVNEISERDYKRSDDKGIKKFVEILESRGITTTVRRKLGADINAACGQLRAEHSKESEV